jgi:predicted transcriptional regulator
MGSAIREKIEREFSWSRRIQAWLDFIEQNMS